MLFHLWPTIIKHKKVLFRLHTFLAGNNCFERSSPAALPRYTTVIRIILNFHFPQLLFLQMLLQKEIELLKLSAKPCRTLNMIGQCHMIRKHWPYSCLFMAKTWPAAYKIKGWYINLEITRKGSCPKRPIIY